MVSIEHLNCGWLHAPPGPVACCHCLMIRDGDRVVLVDTGIGTLDIENPNERIGADAINAAGFQFIQAVTALAQLRERGLDTAAVTDIVLTHCDHDHVGGLADFPNARVHLSTEEKENLDSGNPRYSQAQFDHGPHWELYGTDDSDLFGLPSRIVNCSIDLNVRLVPLFGHTLGHCGVAVENQGKWILHVGDAYYLRDELSMADHPVDQLATLRADDDVLRRQSLDKLRTLVQRKGLPITYCGYHDTGELPESVPSYEDVA